MCGIIGYVGKKHNAISVLIDGLKSLEYRGYDSAGIAFIQDNKLKVVKTSGKVKNLEDKLKNNYKSNIGIGHTRWATHGVPNDINAHPHKVGKVTIVHNGIIENYEELKKELDEYKFVSDTDTEIACALIDSIYKNVSDKVKVLILASKKLRGSYALGIIFDDDKNTIYAMRKDSPLIVGIGTDENFIASDVPAILKYTNKYVLLDKNEYAVITDKRVVIYNELCKKKKKRVEKATWSIDQALKNGYDHFMLKEIYEEPKVVKDIVNKYIYNLKKNMIDFSKYKNIHIVACGSAMHAGMIGKCLLERYAKVNVNVEIASEYRYKDIIYNDNTLVIIISQSGETADSLAALKMAKENNIDTLAIVNVVGSSIAREAKYVMYMGVGPEIAVATTKALSVQVAMLSLITLNLCNNIDVNEFKNIESILNDVLKCRKECSEIAEIIYNKEHLFFIGRGIDYSLCMEGSLKLKEISYIHSEAYPAGELKHGTISLIEQGTPVIAITTDRDLLEKTISNIKEVKARGAYVIYITTKELDIESNFYDKKIVLPTVNTLLNPIITLVPLQLIAYETAKMKGLDIDKPRNLAKSVTVE